MVEFYRRKLWKHWKVFQQHAKIRCIICWRICHPSLLFEWKNHVIRSRSTSENNLGTNRLQQHSFLQNLLEVNVHTITEELDFVMASKRPNVTANQISTINWINVVKEKCKRGEDKHFARGRQIHSHLRYLQRFNMLTVFELRRLNIITIPCNVSWVGGLSGNHRLTDKTFRKQRTCYLKDFVNGTKQQPMDQLHSFMYRNELKNSKAIQMKKCTRLRQSIENWKRNMETVYDSCLVRVHHLLCCSIKRQIKSHLKVHWRWCRIVVTLRKIWKTLFPLIERLHNVCKKVVDVKNIILILATLLWKTFPLSFQRNYHIS